MRNVKTLFGISALAAIAVTAFHLNTTSASAAASCGTKSECACQVALDTGSRGALQMFLRRYPHASTACNASDSTALIENRFVSAPTIGGATPPVVPTSSGGSSGGGDGGGDHDHHGHHGGGDHGDHGEHGDHGDRDDHRHHDDDHKKVVAE